ncbi:MAG: sulfurtransferase TusA family protein [Afipia felis]|nr:sulfurtransferase TusA family protein [Afipia felis]
MSSHRLDLSGLKCPLPVLRTRKALKSMHPGDRLEVVCTDPLAAIDLPHLIGQTGDRIEVLQRDTNGITFLIVKLG